jgi:hypothetical protein
MARKAVEHAGRQATADVVRAALAGSYLQDNAFR